MIIGGILGKDVDVLMNFAIIMFIRSLVTAQSKLCLLAIDYMFPVFFCMYVAI